MQEANEALSYSIYLFGVEENEDSNHVKNGEKLQHHLLKEIYE